MGKQIGIDLGTTNSVAAFFDGTESRVLLNTFQEELTPSVVAVHRFEEGDEGEIAVGRDAVSQAKLFPQDTVFSVKRLMGRPFRKAEVQDWKGRVNYAIVESPPPVAGRAAVMMGGKIYSPEDVSALILRNIKSYAERVLGDEVTHAVITVPAYFGDPERAATYDAGQKAGLVVKTLLPEPTAAAIAFGTEAKADQRFVLVYDLGGGTFDISILSIVQSDAGTPNYNILTVSGDHFLGGDDFDQIIVKMILDHVREKHGLDLSADAQFMTVARQEAERAKKVLSAEEAVRILVPEATQKDGKPISIRMHVMREAFERGIAPMVERARRLVEDALKSQSLAPELIDDVLLVGGSTSVPLVGRSMEALFGKDKIRRSVNPMYCVATGAGVLAARMQGIECPSCKQTRDESERSCGNCGASLTVAKAKLDQLEIQEVTVNQFGIQAVRGTDAHAFWPLVEKGTTVPMKEPKFHTLYTTEPDQPKIRVPVFEGVGATTLQNSQVGVVEYELPRGISAPMNQPVRVGLQVDRQGMVKVVVDIEDFGVRHEVELKREHNEDGEAPLIEDDSDADDGERNFAILEHYIGRASRFLGEYDAVLSAQDKRKVEAAVKEGERALNEDKPDAAMEAIMKLDRALNSCGTPSLIEQARLVASSAAVDTAGELNQLADQLLEHARSGDTVMLAKLRDPVASLIRQEHRRALQTDAIASTKTYDGLLGDRR